MKLLLLSRMLLQLPLRHRILDNTPVSKHTRILVPQVSVLFIELKFQVLKFNFIKRCCR